MSTNTNEEQQSSTQIEIDSFIQNFESFCAENSDQFDLLENALVRCGNPSALDDLYDDCADELKSILGSCAANQSGDHQVKQDEAISFCENWISNNDLSVIGVICWIRGRNEGIKEIENQIRSSSKNRPSM